MGTVVTGDVGYVSLADFSARVICYAGAPCLISRILSFDFGWVPYWGCAGGGVGRSDSDRRKDLAGGWLGGCGTRLFCNKVWSCWPWRVMLSEIAQIWVGSVSG